MTDKNRAILLILSTFFLFTVGDTIRKLLLENYKPIEVQLWCSFFSVAFISLLAPKFGGFKSLKTISKPHIHALKAILLTGIQFAAIYALQYLDLSVFYVIVFTAPFFTILAARVFFAEHLSWQKVVLILIGFTGVLVILRPGSDVSLIGVLTALALSVMFSLTSVANKLFPRGEPLLPFGFYPYGFATVIFLIASGFKPVFLDTTEMFYAFIAGSTSVIGMICSVQAYQYARASDVAPFQYTQLLWGILFGYLLFGNIPHYLNLLGGAIIIISGYFIFKMKEAQ